MEIVNGSCLCGAATYTAMGKPIITRACWCQLCQTLASEHAAINLAFIKDNVSVSGNLNDFQNIADSSNKMHRKFCPECRTHMYSEANERPTILVIRTGTLCEASMIEIEGIIWTTLGIYRPCNTAFSQQPPAPRIAEK